MFRKLTGHGDEYVIKGPGDDQVVIEHHHRTDQHHSVSQAAQEGAEAFVSCHWAKARVLPWGREYCKRERKKGKREENRRRTEETDR